MVEGGMTTQSEAEDHQNKRDGGKISKIARFKIDQNRGKRKLFEQCDDNSGMHFNT